MKSNLLLKLCVYLSFFCLSQIANAGDVLQSAIQNFIGQQTQVKDKEFTVKLKIPIALKDDSSCDKPLIFLPSGAKPIGRTLIGVTCGQQGKSFFINADIRVTTVVLVANRPIHAKSQIDRSDLVEKRIDTTNYAYELLTTYDQAIGKMTKRPLPSGLPIRLEDLQSNEALSAGETVNVLYIGQGFKVTTQGKVINSADLGQHVQVRTMSGQIINGIVKSQKIVEISL